MENISICSHWFSPIRFICFLIHFGLDWHLNFAWKCYMQVLTKSFVIQFSPSSYLNLDWNLYIYRCWWSEGIGATNKNREILSILTFHAPSYDVDISHLPSLWMKIIHVCTRRITSNSRKGVQSYVIRLLLNRNKNLQWS